MNISTMLEHIFVGSVNTHTHTHSHTNTLYLEWTAAETQWRSSCPSWRADLYSALYEQQCSALDYCNPLDSIHPIIVLICLCVTTSLGPRGKFIAQRKLHWVLSCFIVKLCVYMIRTMKSPNRNIKSLFIKCTDHESNTNIGGEKRNYK